jgi:hypothetical protein
MSCTLKPQRSNILNSHHGHRESVCESAKVHSSPPYSPNKERSHPPRTRESHPYIVLPYQPNFSAHILTNLGNPRAPSQRFVTPHPHPHAHPASVPPIHPLASQPLPQTVLPPADPNPRSSVVDPPSEPEMPVCPLKKQPHHTTPLHHPLAISACCFRSFYSASFAGPCASTAFLHWGIGSEDGFRVSYRR